MCVRTFVLSLRGDILTFCRVSPLRSLPLPLFPFILPFLLFFFLRFFKFHLPFSYFFLSLFPCLCKSACLFLSLFLFYLPPFPLPPFFLFLLDVAFIICFLSSFLPRNLILSSSISSSRCIFHILCNFPLSFSSLNFPFSSVLVRRSFSFPPPYRPLPLQGPAPRIPSLPLLPFTPYSYSHLSPLAPSPRPSQVRTPPATDSSLFHHRARSEGDTTADWRKERAAILSGELQNCLFT